MTVYYSTPYKEGDIGGGLNDFCRIVPNFNAAGRDNWICLRDADTCFLTPLQQKQIQDITNSNPPFDVIGALVNRLGDGRQTLNGFCDPHDDMRWHIDEARRIEKDNWGLIKPVSYPLAGCFLLFRKHLWMRHQFKEGTARFDTEFSLAVHAAHGRLGLAVGLYLWHTYRLWSDQPQLEVSHLPIERSYSGLAPFAEGSPTT